MNATEIIKRYDGRKFHQMRTVAFELGMSVLEIKKIIADGLKSGEIRKPSVDGETWYEVVAKPDIRTAPTSTRRPLPEKPEVYLFEGDSVSLKDVTPVQLIARYNGKLTPTIADIAKEYKVGKTKAQKRIAAGIEAGDVIRKVEGSKIWYEVPSLGVKTLPRTTRGLTQQALQGGCGEKESYTCKSDWEGVDFSHMDVATNDGGVWPGNYPAFRAGYLGNGID